MSTKRSTPYKVIQWATGPVGRSALRHIINNPDYELVGVLAYCAEKSGVDAGSPLGLPDTGIKATTDRDDIDQRNSPCLRPPAGNRLPGYHQLARRPVGASLDGVSASRSSRLR